jgi:hypothetical protein
MSSISLARLRMVVLAASLCAAASRLHAVAASCMVLGDTTARVAAAEGVRSPVFETSSCARLRLLQGQAMAGWVSLDGTPRLTTITAHGPTRLPQGPGTRSTVARVWAQLTTTRPQQRAAYSRAIGVPHFEDLYMPETGLSLTGSEHGSTLVRISADGAAPTRRIQIRPRGALRLKAAWFRPGQRYRVDVQGPSSERVYLWHVLGPRESAQVEARLNGLARSLPDARQRVVMDALVLYQMGLRANLDLLRAQWHHACH